MHLKLSDENSIRDALFLIKQHLQQHHASATLISEFVTLSSELCYNAVRHSGQQTQLDFTLDSNGAELEIRDAGPGFNSLGERAFVEGFTTSDSLGLGLGAVVRMSDDFELETSHTGTRIKVLKRLSYG